MEDRARAVSHGMELERPITDERRSGAQLTQPRGDIARTSVRTDCQRRVRLHRTPDMHASQGANPFLDQRIGGEVEDVACSESRNLPGHGFEDATKRIEEAGLPNEVQRIHAVLLPPLDVLERDLQAITLADQAAVGPHGDAQRLAGGKLRGPCRNVLANDRVDVAFGRRIRAALLEETFTEIDDMRTQRFQFRRVKVVARACTSREVPWDLSVASA